MTSREIDEKCIKQGRMMGEYIIGERDTLPCIPSLFGRGKKGPDMQAPQALVAMRTANEAAGREGAGAPGGGDDGGGGDAGQNAARASGRTGAGARRRARR